MILLDIVRKLGRGSREYDRALILGLQKKLMEADTVSKQRDSANLALNQIKKRLRSKDN